MIFSDILSASHLRSNLYQTLREVVSKNMALKVTSKGGNVVIIPEEEYSAMRETFYLMSNPANAARLQEGIDQLNQGKTVTKTLDELDQLVD